jgi:hypothetical protein
LGRVVGPDEESDADETEGNEKYGGEAGRKIAQEKWKRSSVPSVEESRKDKVLLEMIDEPRGTP